MSKEALEAFFKKFPRTGAVSDDIVQAVKTVESAGDDYAVSPSGAIGPMQIQASSHGLEPADVAKPEVNMEVGARYLDKLYAQFGGNLHRALRAYNQGPGNERRKEANGSQESRVYPDKVMAAWKKKFPVKSEWDNPNTPLPELPSGNAPQTEPRKAGAPGIMP